MRRKTNPEMTQLKKLVNASIKITKKFFIFKNPEERLIMLSGGLGDNKRDSDSRFGSF